MNFEYLRQLISDLAHVPSKNVHVNSVFRDDLGIDSLQMVNLLLGLSERVGINFERFMCGEDISTVGGIYQIILKGHSNDDN